VKQLRVKDNNFAHIKKCAFAQIMILQN